LFCFCFVFVFLVLVFDLLVVRTPQDQRTFAVGMMEGEKTVVAKRTGQVLYKGTILKADHWLGGHQKSPVPFRLSGAPNFRTVRSFYFIF
jgi:hypothetical protein